MTGLSFDSKYTGIFIIIGVIGFLLIAKPYRKLLFSVWSFLYLLCFAITILPVVIWNMRNHFASFKFQSEGRVKEGISFDPSGFAGVVGHQSAILLPLLFFSLVYFIYRFCSGPRKCSQFGKCSDRVRCWARELEPVWCGLILIASAWSKPRSSIPGSDTCC